MRTVAFIPARLTSARLSHKVLRTIGDVSVLDWVIRRLQASRQIDAFVLCTPDEEASAPLADFAKLRGIEYFTYPGNVDDVVGRLVAAARKYNAELCVLASGDCPLLSTASMDMLIRQMKKLERYDVARFASSKGRNVCHEGIQVATREAWERADRCSLSPELREHQFPVLYRQHPGFEDLWHLDILDKPLYYSIKHRMSVDTPADLRFHNTLYTRLVARHEEYTIDNCVRLLQEEPELMHINESVYQKKVEDESRSVVLSPSTDQELKLALRLAETLTNEHGMGVKFESKNAAHVSLIQQAGFTLHQSADGMRPISTSKDRLVFRIVSEDRGGETRSIVSSTLAML